MTKSLLSQFQGTLVGAALASVSLPDFVPATSSPGWGGVAVQLGQALVTPATVDPAQAQSDPLPLSDLSQDFVTCFDVALALLPLTLCTHDATLAADSGLPLEQSPLLTPFSLTPSFQNHWQPLLQHRSPASTVLSACLSASLRHPAWVPAELRQRGLAFLPPIPDQRLGSVLRQVEHSLAFPTDGTTLARSLATALQQTPLQQHPFPGSRCDSDLDLLLLGLVLYCFFDSPDDYAVAALRLRQVFQQLYHAKGYGLIGDSPQDLPASQLASAAALLGALAGGFNGLDGIPLAEQVRLELSPLSDRLYSFWAINLKSLMILAEHLWAFWSGIDMIGDRSLSSILVTAVPNAIREFGH